MAILSLFYAASGYLALLAAIFWGMLFVGDGVTLPRMDAAGTAAPVEAALIDLGLLLLLALLHLGRGMLREVAQRSLPRGLERGTQAWAAAAVLAALYFGWRPLPQVLWSAAGPLQAALSALFYIAWTLILIGAFLASHLDLFEGVEGSEAAPSAATARKPPDTVHHPLYWGILMAVWATSVMTVGRMLLAAAVTAYLLLDVLALAVARRGGAARASRRALSLQDQRAAS